jgi:hypothetical protein
MHVTASVLTDAHAGPVLLSSEYEAPAFAKGSDWESVSGQQDGNCFRGILLGFCLEGALGLCLYGMWQVWHIVR